MKNRFSMIALCAASAMIAMPGCNKESKTTQPKTTSTASMGAMNDKCPLTGMPVNKNAPTATYRGTCVAFCCGGCATKFDAMTDTKKEETISKMATTAK